MEEKGHQPSGKTVGGGETEKSGKGTGGKKCDWCLREGYTKKDCFSRKDVNGTELTNEHPAKAPEGFFQKKTSAAKKPMSSNKRKQDTDSEAEEDPGKKDTTSAVKT
jgi:hypothetical protein